MLAASDARNVRLVLAPAKDADDDADDEAGRRRREAYVRPAPEMDPGTFDLALVDGCLRARCADEALRLLAPGGFLALDDSQRYLPGAPNLPGGCGSSFPSGLWSAFAARVSSWEVRHFVDGISRMTVWRRPLEGSGLRTSAEAMV